MHSSILKGSSTTLVELGRHNIYAKPTIVALPNPYHSRKPEPREAYAATITPGFQDAMLQQAMCNVQDTDATFAYNTYNGRTRARDYHTEGRSMEATGGRPKRASSLGKQNTAFSSALTSNHIRRAGRVRLDLGRLTKFGGVATKAAVDLFQFRKHQVESNRPMTAVAESPCPISAEYANDIDDQCSELSQQSPLDYTRYCRPPVFGPPAQPKYATIYMFNENATMYPPQFQDAEDTSDSSTMYNSGEEEDSFRIVEIKRTGSIFRSMPQLVNIERSGDGYSIVPAVQQLRRPTD
ncbi:hypothetical protein LPJ59_003583 [Coemansia sp. RSA 2399]|nr:hypothetical protein LPJ59_003583 [Coemansia sp. RSA 2399]KAJ1903150.1 hypothetical protein LPJ81_003212 [Coemansia sp. IMI 209127]